MQFASISFQNSNICDMLGVESLRKIIYILLNYLHIAFYQMEICLEVDKDFKGLLKT